MGAPGEEVPHDVEGVPGQRAVFIDVGVEEPHGRPPVSGLCHAELQVGFRIAGLHARQVLDCLHEGQRTKVLEVELRARPPVLARVPCRQALHQLAGLRRDDTEEPFARGEQQLAYLVEPRAVQARSVLHPESRVQIQQAHLGEEPGLVGGIDRVVLVAHEVDRRSQPTHLKGVGLVEGLLQRPEVCG